MTGNFNILISTSYKSFFFPPNPYKIDKCSSKKMGKVVIRQFTNEVVNMTYSYRKTD